MLKHRQPKIDVESLILATLRFTTRAQQRGRLQEEILELFLKNVDESIESANFV